VKLPRKGSKKLNCFAYLITTRASNFAHTFEFRARSRDKDRTAIRSAVPESAAVTFATGSIATCEVVSENEMKLFVFRRSTNYKNIACVNLRRICDKLAPVT